MDNPELFRDKGYEVKERIGSGGMGSVYRAEQIAMKRDVAIKILPDELANNPNYFVRFNREAETLTQLEHPHIVPVYDYGAVDKTSYIVMRLLTGGSLNQRLALSEVLPIAETRRIIRQLGSALDYAHKKGIIHRDIKASNVMLDEQGNAYLTDFGIAKLLDATGFTATGMMLGTPAYMAPEQWKGTDSNHTTDTYALGILLYAMLTGQMPFEAPTPYALMDKHLNDKPSPPSERHANLPTAVNDVIFKAIAKVPNERFQSAGQLSEAFDSAFTGIRTKLPADATFVPDIATATAIGIPQEELPTTAVDQARLAQELNPPTTDMRAQQVPPPSGTSRRSMLIAIPGILLVLALIALFILYDSGVFDSENANESNENDIAGLTVDDENNTATSDAQNLASTNADATNAEATNIAADATSGNLTQTAVALLSENNEQESPTPFVLPTDTTVPSPEASNTPTDIPNTNTPTQTSVPPEADVFIVAQVSDDTPEANENVFMTASISNDGPSEVTVEWSYELEDEECGTGLISPITESGTATLAAGDNEEIAREVYEAGVTCSATMSISIISTSVEDTNLTQDIDQISFEFIQATDTPVPTDTLTPTFTFTPSPSPTLTPSPTWTPLPTATWTPLPTATLIPTQVIGLPGGRLVTSNDEWTPITRTINGVEMALVPAGTYQMGRNLDTVDGQIGYEEDFEVCLQVNFGSGTCENLLNDEIQNLNIIFSEPFWIDVTEASDASGYPVVNIDWRQAQTQCENRGGRLPTEAEWEYAAKGPSNYRYPWGNDPFSRPGLTSNICDGTNCSSNWAQSGWNDSYAEAAPVGSYPDGASWVGALDMGGNVWEWTSSIYRNYPYDENDGRENTSNSTTQRTLRGGGWTWILAESSTTARATHISAGPYTTYYGFRCLREYQDGDLETYTQ